MTGPALPTADVHLHRRIDGPAGAPALVLSNSLGTNLAMWDGLMPELIGRFRVVRYDMRGHGRSPVPRGPYALTDLAGDLLAILDDEGIERAHLAGISLGGLVSLLVAVMAPGRVESLTVLSAPARFANAEGYRERAALVRARGVESVAAAVLGRWLTPVFRMAHPGIAASLEAMIAATPAEGYAACCEAVAGADLREGVTGIDASALCIAAAEDPAVDPEDVRALARSLPHGRFVLTAGAAHLQVLEKPAEIGRLIVKHALASDRLRRAGSSPAASGRTSTGRTGSKTPRTGAQRER